MRYRCTKEAPWHEGMPTPVEHDAAHEVGDQEDGWPGGDIVTMECSNCGHRWRKELSQ
jgi:hypothetical protein